MIEGMDRRLVIIGAGPIGLYFSFLIKKQNPNLFVVVLEKNKDLNNSSCCTGIISINSFKKTELSNFIKSKDFVINEIRNIDIFGPYKANLKIKGKENKAYVIDRKKFSMSIRNLAKSIGVEIKPNQKLLEIKENELIVKNTEKDKIYNLKYDILVGADGPDSLVRKSIIGKISNKDFIHAYQVRVTGKFQKDKTSIYFGDFAKGLFAWVVPESIDTARIGVGTYLGKNPKDSLDKFAKKYDINISNKIDTCSGVIPISKIFSYASDKRIVIGDAACFVKATTGGGINFGLLSTEIAVKAVTERLNKFKRLKHFNVLIDKYTRSLKLHYKIHKFINSKTNVELDEFLLRLKNLGAKKFLEDYGNMDFPSKFLPKLILKPKFIYLFKQIINFIKS